MSDAKSKPDAGKLLTMATEYAAMRAPDLARAVGHIANPDAMRSFLALEITRAYVGGAISAVDLALKHLREEAARQGVKLKADFGIGL